MGGILAPCVVAQCDDPTFLPSSFFFIFPRDPAHCPIGKDKVLMHLFRIEMVEFLVARMLRDDCESSRTYPDPQIMLEGLCLVKGPYLSASHFSEAVAGVHIIAIL